MNLPLNLWTPVKMFFEFRAVISAKSDLVPVFEQYIIIPVEAGFVGNDFLQINDGGFVNTEELRRIQFFINWP